MAVPALPPAIDLGAETKKGVIDGLKKVIEAFHEAGLLDKSIAFGELIHNPDILWRFIQDFRANPGVAAKIVVDRDGNPVNGDEEPLSCGVTLKQVQQLLVKTCARYILTQDTRQEEEVVTESRTVTRFLFFKKTEKVKVKTGGGFDERKVRELSRFMAYDWQLPLLTAYAMLSTTLLMELGDDTICLTNADDIAFVARLEPAMLKKVKQTVGDDFQDILAKRPRAIPGISYWSKDMYGFYRSVLEDKAWDFFARDKPFFMVCASLEKPMARVYGDVLCYIAAPNLEELQRLNIDKTDVLLAGMKYAFGARVTEVLSQPGFAKDILRKLVESLLHINQEKDQLMISAQLTCKAITPQVIQWLTKQPPAAS